MKTIVICGSMRFKDIMIEEQCKLALEGNIVILPTIQSSEKKMSEEDIGILKAVHREKIKKADLVYVINSDNYIGEDGMEEIIFAARCGIPLRFYTWPTRLFNVQTVMRDSRTHVGSHDHTSSMNNARGLTHEL